MNWLVSLTIVCLAVQCGTVVQYREDVYRSLAFVFDTTGSMGNDFKQFKSQAENIMNYLLERNNTNIKHFVFVPFNDPGIVDIRHIIIYYISIYYDIRLKCPVIKNKNIYTLNNTIWNYIWYKLWGDCSIVNLEIWKRFLKYIFNVLFLF